MACTTSIAEHVGDRPLIYALGGGMGHVTRAANVLRAVGSGVVLHQAPRVPELVSGSRAVALPAGADAEWVAGFVRDALVDCEVFVVDTFPAGVAHELGDDLLDLRPNALIQRYVRPGSYDDYERLAARFDRRLRPYGPSGDEWDDADGTHVGPIRRALAFQGDAVPLLVIGRAEGLPPGWRALLPPHVAVDGPFDALPRAERILTVGAGYNLVHELLDVGAAHVPIDKRYDDQFRRAGRLGRAITSRAELRAFVNG